MAVEGHKEGRNGGTLLRHPPGSNGGVHRGPDRQLRINAVRGLILQALAAPQARLVKVEGKKRRVTVEVPMAMCDDIVAGLQLVARLGAQGRCLPEFLRMTFGLHQAMQPGAHEKNGNGHGGPKVATFVMAQAEPSAEEPGQAPATEPGTLIGPDGKEYVSACGRTGGKANWPSIGRRGDRGADRHGPRLLGGHVGPWGPYAPPSTGRRTAIN